MSNQITEVKLTLLHGEWKIEVTKEFAPEYGGGSQVFTESGGPQIHEAIRHAAGMVTLTPSYREAHGDQGLQVSEARIAEVGPVMASIEAPTFEERYGPWICAGCGKPHTLGDPCPDGNPIRRGND
jgi:hypothetical protein